MMTRITDITYISKRKVQVSLDGNPAFVLTSAEFRDLGIFEGMDLDEEGMQTLDEQIGRIAAREAMSLLMKQDYSRKALLDKLVQKGMTHKYAEYAIDYVTKYHYLDDHRYAEHFAEINKDRYSISVMKMKLRQKGISDSDIEDVLSDQLSDDCIALEREINKKLKKYNSVDEISEDMIIKLIQSLMRKGFKYGDIKDTLKKMK